MCPQQLKPPGSELLVGPSVTCALEFACITATSRPTSCVQAGFVGKYMAPILASASRIRLCKSHRYGIAGSSVCERHGEQLSACFAFGIQSARRFSPAVGLLGTLLWDTPAPMILGHRRRRLLGSGTNPAAGSRCAVQ
ncbi:hypothetical protein AV530_001864 [Patagioenas fasciata monilis]|uniref:Uncharacterized protein n=1 Tax=Patagioenas fasciata monilis TaxID=372326 RepID=A0A1V4J5S1_PATFA|nr:hypothetical protein AV530_001864 [Patagioenas fasciata monilis]